MNNVELVEVRGSVCPFWSDCDIHRLARDEANMRSNYHRPRPNSILLSWCSIQEKERTEYPKSEFDVQGEEQERHSAESSLILAMYSVVIDAMRHQIRLGAYVS